MPARYLPVPYAESMPLVGGRPSAGVGRFPLRVRRQPSLGQRAPATLRRAVRSPAVSAGLGVLAATAAELVVRRLTGRFATPGTRWPVKPDYGAVTLVSVIHIEVLGHRSG